MKTWWPLAILGLVGMCVALFGALVMQHIHHAQSLKQSLKQTPILASAHGNKQADEVHTPSLQHVIHWRMVTSWPKNFPGLGTAPERFAQQVNRMSGGRLTISVHAAGELVPALGVFDAVSSGSVEMGHSGAYFWKGKIPAAQLFTSVPFGMNAQEMNGWLYHGNGLALWREIYKPFGVIPFPGGNTGVQMGGWFNKRIDSVDDLKGLKMRLPGIGGEVLNRAGGTAVTIPGGELFGALKAGVIDATEWVGPYNDAAFSFHKAAKYYYYPGWHEPGSVLEFTINERAWQQLPTDLQAIVSTAIQASNEDMLAEYTARNNAALQRLIKQEGVQVLAFPKSVLDKLNTLSKIVLQEQADKDKQFAKVYASFRAFKEQSETYHNYSERAFYNTRK